MKKLDRTERANLRLRIKHAIADIKANNASDTWVSVGYGFEVNAEKMLTSYKFGTWKWSYQIRNAAGSFVNAGTVTIDSFLSTFFRALDRCCPNCDAGSLYYGDHSAACRACGGTGLIAASKASAAS